MSCRSYRVPVSPGYYDSLLLLLIVFLGSCAIQPPVPESDRQNLWDTRQETLRQLDNWNLTGRMSFRNENEAWSASLYWREKPEQFEIQIVAPLGQGGIEITGNDNSVHISSDDGQVYQQDEVELMMLQNLGWRMPASALRYWVKGMPDPGTNIDKVDIDDQGRLLQLVQSGWSIFYPTYTRADQHHLPSRIELQREDSNIRMIINYWNLSP